MPDRKSYARLHLVIDDLSPQAQPGARAMVKYIAEHPDLLDRVPASFMAYAAGDDTAWNWVDDLYDKINEHFELALSYEAPDAWRYAVLLMLGGMAVERAFWGTCG